MRIFIDLDNTFWDLNTVWIEMLNQKYNIEDPVNPTDIIHYYLPSAFEGLTEEQVNEPLSDSKLWANIEPYPNAIKTVRCWQMEGWETYFVTSSHYSTIQTKMENAFNRILKGVATWDDVIVTNKKHLLQGDVLIDDYIENLKLFNGEKFVYKQPWNKDTELRRSWRVSDWYSAEWLMFDFAEEL